MSKFKYCPMCGNERDEDIEVCPNCDFKFLTGKYVRVNEKTVEKIQFEKVSQDEFVESNQLIIDINLKINTLISKYLNYALSNQYDVNYEENISFAIKEYISSYINSDVSKDFKENYLDCTSDMLADKEYEKSIVVFLQWIDENRSHLPGIVLNQYMIPHQSNINVLEEILNLDLDGNDENRLFFDLVNKFLLSEKEFLNRLI